MSTQIIGGNPNYTLEQITNYTGSATTSHNVELTVDMATTIVKDSGATRQIQREELLLLLNLFEQYITRMNWPPVAS